MTFGDPQDFAIHIELLEASDDRYWLYGIFFFIIDDLFYIKSVRNIKMKMLDIIQTYKANEMSLNQKNQIYNNLKKIMIENKILYSYFAIGIPDCDDHYCFHEENGFWLVYYSERGQREPFCVFSDLDDAVKFYLLSTLKDTFSIDNLHQQLRSVVSDVF